MALKKTTTKTPAPQDEEGTDAFRDPQAEADTQAEIDDAEGEDEKGEDTFAKEEPSKPAEKGAESDLTATQQIHSSALPYADRDPDKAWQDYASQAIATMYPHMREGVDYSYGRRAVEEDAEMLEWNEKFAPPDMGKIEELARKMVAQDPYANYKPKPGLASGSQPEQASDREILDPDVAQSEVNPQRDGNEKTLSQPYQQQPEAFERDRQKE